MAMDDDERRERDGDVGAAGGGRDNSDRVWEEVVMGGGGGLVGIGTSHSERPWTIQAVRPDGSFGDEYTFCEPRTE
jgi:hypothetical protein